MKKEKITKLMPEINLYNEKIYFFPKYEVFTIITLFLLILLMTSRNIDSLNVSAATTSNSESTCHVTETSPITSVSISASSATLYKGATKTLTLTMNGGTGTVTWSSSNSQVASVSSNGVVTAKKAGTATITAKVSGFSKSCKITVKNPSIKLSKKSLSLAKGKSTTLKATVCGSSSKVTWKSSNTSIATVNSSGKITGKKAGNVTITATANGVKATCKVKVVLVTTYYVKGNSIYQKSTTGKVKKITSEKYSPSIVTTYGGYVYYFAGDEDSKFIRCSVKTGKKKTLINCDCLDDETRNSNYIIISSGWRDPQGNNPGWIFNIKKGTVKKIKKWFFPGSCTIIGNYVYFAVDVDKGKKEDVCVYRCKMDASGLTLKGTIHFYDPQFVYYAWNATDRYVDIYYVSGYDSYGNYEEEEKRFYY